jgi:hypothetical protein
LNRSNLVVRVHHRHERGLVRQSGIERRRRHDAARVDRQQRRRPAATGEGLEGIQDRLVLDRSRYQMAPAGRLERFRHSAEGEVVRLGPAAREHDLGRLGREQLRDARARLVEHCFGALTEMVDARGVAEFVAQHAHHHFGDRRVDRRGCVVIEVDAHR